MRVKSDERLRYYTNIVVFGFRERPWGQKECLSSRRKAGKRNLRLNSKIIGYFYVLHNSQVKIRNQSLKTTDEIVLIDLIK